MDPAELLLRLADELFHRLAIANIAPPGMHLDAHGAQRGLGQERLLADVASRHVHIAKTNVAPEPAELHRDVPSQSGGTTGDESDLAPPPLPDGLQTRLFEGGTGPFRRLVLPRGPVSETEGWQRHGVRSYRANWGVARSE